MMVLDIRQALNDPTKSSQFGKHIAAAYFTPAFGALSKSEIDLLVFTALIEASVIDPRSPIYDLSRTLNITPTRARTLVMNWQLRDPKLRNDLTELLRDALQKTRFSKDGTLLTFGIESPLLKEEVGARLRAKGVFADASFSREIVRMPVDAFVEFLDDIIDDQTKKEFVAKLTKDKQLPDKSFKGIAAGVLSQLGKKVAGEAGSMIAGDMVDAAAPIAKSIGKLLIGLARGKVDEAVEAASNFVTSAE